jgi:superfamily II DNA or RNA helicase
MLRKRSSPPGRYLGEGFDDERLDTLFLTLPISWRDTLNQYAGRLHRIYDSKKKVVIYDYADLNVPVLARMYDRRLKGYRSLGYEIKDDNSCILDIIQAKTVRKLGLKSHMKKRLQ